jgi:hypothetical protein
MAKVDPLPEIQGITKNSARNTMIIRFMILRV